MNCRIDVPSEELQRFSPNLTYVLSLLEALAPDHVEGKIGVKIEQSAVILQFRGAGFWREEEHSSAKVPRWMFCESAFRELLANRVDDFIAQIEGLSPPSRN